MARSWPMTYSSICFLISAGSGMANRVVFGFFSFVFFGNDVVAELDAFVADVYSGTGDEFFHLVLAFAAKRTQQVGTFVSTAFAHTVRPPQASGVFPAWYW